MAAVPIILRVLLFATLFGLNVFSQSPMRDEAKETALENRLKETAPQIVESFRTATKAMDSGDFEVCVAKNYDVLSKAPNFDPAMRRLGFCLISLGKKEEGIASIQQAIDLDRSGDNLISMAVAISETWPADSPPPKSEMEEALSLATEASSRYGEPDTISLLMIADLSLRLDRFDQFRSTVLQLTSTAPEHVGTHYFRSIYLADRGDFDGAIAAIETARSLGLDPVETQRITGAIENMRNEAYPYRPYLSFIYFFLAIVAVWAIGLLGLYVLGRRLSSRTLAAIETSDPNLVTDVASDSLRKSYRRLINFASIYYYVSQPMVVAVVIAATGAVILGFFLLGTIPIGFLIGLVFVGAGSIFYMFKSLIIRPKVEDPGRLLANNEAPKLWDLVKTVAGDINTRPIDEIRITPGVEMAVYERGTFREKLNDGGQRILILGAGSLNGFSINAFRSVLAHEYGHLSHRDTAGGDVAFRVSSDMMRAAEAMVEGGTNTYHNLAFHFLRLYHFIFRRITHGASRLQEVLADRIAIKTYGKDAFCEGLRHVFRQGVMFNCVADAEISAALADRRKFHNFYDKEVDEKTNIAELEKTFEEEFSRPSTEDDTHPGGSERVRLAEKILGQVEQNIPGIVWDLFEDRAKITSDMILMVEESVRGERFTNYHEGNAGTAD